MCAKFVPRLLTDDQREQCQTIGDLLERSCGDVQPRKSIRQASRELGVPCSTVHDIVHKRLHLRAYKLQLLHHIKPDDHHKRTDFAVEMLSHIEEKDIYLDLLLFSDESTFHV